MDLDRMRKLAGIDTGSTISPSQLNESQYLIEGDDMSDEEKLAAYEKAFKDEVDPRARSVVKAQIAKLKAKLGK